MDSRTLKQISKTMSLALRHKPELFGISLDENGWTDSQILLKALQKRLKISFENMETVVAENDKQRFAFNADKTLIRANQGHSVEIDLDLKAQNPPSMLFHGTIEANRKSIAEKGLLKGKRNHVHLSKDTETAEKVAKRHGANLLILKVLSAEMQAEGFLFFQSDNGVWLTDQVPSKFIDFEYKNKPIKHE